MDNAYARAYIKIFKTFDAKIETECQFYMGKLRMEMEVSVRRLTFLSHLLNCNKIDINQVLNIKVELQSIVTKFEYPVVEGANVAIF